MTGKCTVQVPEELFDMDGPGHYFRRIKSVAVSIPSVVGPYSSVNCTLTLLKSSIRTSSLLSGGAYARQGGEDPRFNDYFGSMQSIVTSGGQNDSGMFEANLRDERYLPFEGSGVISEWDLQLPANPSTGQPRQFDYDTISDVILHIRYTAREGGGPLRGGAVENLTKRIESATAAGSVRLFSVRHEFPTEWAKFKRQPQIAGKRFALELTLRPEHYPYWSDGRLGFVHRRELIARKSIASDGNTLFVFDAIDVAGANVKSDELIKPVSAVNLWHSTLTNIKQPATPEGTFSLFFETRDLDDLWLAVTWGKDNPNA
jgi:hypothetical protein